VRSHSSHARPCSPGRRRRATAHRHACHYCVPVNYRWRWCGSRCRQAQVGLLARKARPAKTFEQAPAGDRILEVGSSGISLRSLLG